MFMNDVSKKEEIRNAVLEELRSIGIKYRPKKLRQNVQEQRRGSRVFGIPLHLLPMQTVALESGQQLVVPKLIHQLCSYVLNKVETEGLFRKEGSKSRQNEIKLSLNAGCSLGEEHHVIDIACLLKTFFRDLPEPLFPQNFHDLFLRCTILQDNVLKASLLGCLLLTTEHLNTLAYFMQFLQYVSEFSSRNKMDAYNLAIIFGPTLMPLDSKSASQTTQHQMSKVCLLFKLLIENSIRIGVLPESVIDRIESLSSSLNSLVEEENVKKKRRRRSGSLTRMFNGLIKMVGGNNGKLSEEASGEKETTPNIMLTPKLTKSAKKRKIESTGISQKKKKELVSNLPQNAILNTPYTPIKTPVCGNPNPKRISTPESTQKSITPNTKLALSKNRKSQWNLVKKQKPQKKETKTSSLAPSYGSGTRSLLDLNWPSVSFKKNRKRSSYVAPSKKSSTIDSNGELENSPDSLEVETKQDIVTTPTTKNPDFIEVPRTEYEEIKNRISTIEKGLEMEIEALESAVNNTDVKDGIAKVQTEYEKILTTSENLSPTTDQLARRLSKELKIRKSSEHKVMRSPSARKIGSLRRRSRELDNKINNSNNKNKVKLTRTRTWHDESVRMAKRVSFKRGKNTSCHSKNQNLPDVVNKVPQASTSTTQLMCDVNNRNVQHHQRASLNLLISSETPKPIPVFRRSLNFENTRRNSSNLSEKWTSAEGFFRTLKTPTSGNSLDNCRASIARLRSQNAGMVMAKAKLFDHLSESDESQKCLVQKTVNNKLPTCKKIGSIRVADKTRTMRYSSPRKRACKVVHPNMKGSFNNSSLDKENFFVAVEGANKTKREHNNVVAKNVPVIKRSLTKRSPKRLAQTGSCHDLKKTPLKVVVPSDLNC